MDRLWDEGRAVDVRDVHAAVGLSRGLARNTIQSTLERLVRKDLATRRRRGRAYEYAAVGTRRAWIAEAFDALVDGLGKADRAEVLAGFVEFAERTSASTLEALQQLVARRLGERGRDDAS